jgi:hypothetical protein
MGQVANEDVWLGRYRVEEALGEGAHGAVYLAEDRVAGGWVALKLVAVHHADDAWVRAELAALRRLKLPGVAELRDAGLERGHAVFVLRYAPGQPFPGRAAPVAWATLAPTAFALLEVLDRIHAYGVLHRDLKPTNVVVEPTGLVTVLDFGVSGGEAVRLARGGVGDALTGTPAYWAPEQLRGAADARADVYAAALMIVEALLGALPFDTRSPVAVVAAKQRRLGVEASLRARGVPIEVAAALERALSPSPDERPQTALALLAALGGPLPEARVIARLERLDPRDVDALRGLFVGPDRLFHLAEDAAEELWQRTRAAREDPSVSTDELRRRVGAELVEWTRAGIATWERDRVAVERAALDALSRARRSGAGASALVVGTREAIDAALYGVMREDLASQEARAAELILRAARCAIDGEGVRALELLDAHAALLPPSLELLARATRSLAAHRAPIERAVDNVEALEGWARRVGTPAAARLALEWRGRLAYRRGAFADAARLHAEEAALCEDEPTRLGAMSRAASASMESFDLARAAELAGALAARAALHRHAHFEARGEWLLRATAYRRGQALVADEALVDAVRLLGVVQLEGLVTLNEAAIAWRANDGALALRLAEAAAARWRASSTPPGADLARALAWTAGASWRPAEAREVAVRAAACPIPGLGLQTVGLVARLGVGRSPISADTLDRLASSVPREFWGVRMDVLSVEEAMSYAVVWR